MEFEELRRVRTVYEKRARGTSPGEKRLLYFSSLRARARVLEISPLALKKLATATQAIPRLNLRRSQYFVFSFGFLPFCVTQCSAVWKLADEVLAP